MYLFEHNIILCDYKPFDSFSLQYHEVDSKIIYVEIKKVLIVYRSS